MKSSIKISNGGNTIRATGAAANEIFNALANPKPDNATPRPWRMEWIDGKCLIFEGARPIPIAEFGWSLESNFYKDSAIERAQRAVNAVNEHAALEAVAEDMATVLVAEFGSLKNARHLAQSQKGIGYWAQIVHNYEQLAAIRGQKAGGK